jgi:meso-butanediol dehydrogenase / (S,S)-butanediol dehydrogenase / diacetyl reductase
VRELLESKLILITGAAGGIGSAAATHFAEQGATVVLSDIKGDSVKQHARKLTQQGFRAGAISADLLIEEEVARLFDQVATQFGRIDGAFCNAGIGYQQNVEETAGSAFDRVMAVNVRSVFLCCKYAFRAMRENRSGAIVITSSRAALAAYPHMSPYIASKGALLSMTRALAVDFGSYGIRVNAVLPGATETPMFKEEVEASGRPVEMRAYFQRQSLLGGLAQPSDIAAAAAFLLSDSARFISGTSLVVDGGCLARLYEGPSSWNPMSG